MPSLIQQIKKIANISEHIDIESAQNYIKSNIEFKGPNVWILIFAIAIASVGLNVNSIPVVIGAMLISPIMGPIMGIGMSLGINDTILLKKSFKNLMIMTIISVFASTVFFLITPLALESPTELLARTNPTIYDVAIAIFGGFAVIVEVCKKEKGTVISGVAIATALMPPLCTAGYGLANGNMMYFIGALYLYFINSVFIALATFITTRYLNFPMVKWNDAKRNKRVHRIITIFTIVLIIPSIYSAIIVIKENKFNQSAKNFVAENKNLNNCYIYDYQIKHSARNPSILSISIAGEALSKKDRIKLYDNLSKFNINKEQLKIDQNNTFIPDNIKDKEIVKTIFEQNEQEVKKREELISNLEKELGVYRKKEFPSKQLARELSAQYPNLESFTLARGEKVVNNISTEEVIAIIRFKGHISIAELNRLKQWLAIRIEVPSLRIIEEK